MAVCPKCDQRLVRTKTEHGMVFRCAQCDGRAAGFSVLRRAMPPKHANALWAEARRSTGVQGQGCPVCRRAMVEVSAAGQTQNVTLDVCARCQFVWFDPHEFEHVQEPAVRTRQDDCDRLSQQAREAMAMVDLQADARRRRDTDSRGDGPEEFWQYLPAMLGMPVEREVGALERWPWITWGLAAGLVLTFAMTVGRLATVVQEFGLVPAEVWRYGGITLATSFFLHGGLFHLIGNVYFLLVFGDNVEDHVGRWRFALLLLGAALLGDLLHVVADPRATVPCVGASGGISGVIVFYALKFPHARLGLLLRLGLYVRWVHMPAIAALVGWFLLQLLLAYQQLVSDGGVSALAHLGGAAAGFLAWCLWHERRQVRQEESFASLRDPERFR